MHSSLSLAAQMGPKDDNVSASLALRGERRLLFAALVNAAACYAVKLDDLSNGRMIHPIYHRSNFKVMIVNSAVAATQDVGCSGDEFVTSCDVGYKCKSS
jgi:hypothetical protein